MEKEHVPSSPLQHHRHPSAQASDPAPLEGESSKLNATFTPALTRPTSSHALGSPPVATASITGWNEPHPHVGPEHWREQHHVPLWDGHGSSTQPIASSSRCPSPASPMELPLPDSAPLAPLPPHIRSSLLTSEPLNRSTSQSSSFAAPAPRPTSLSKRRKRALSEPTDLCASPKKRKVGQPHPRSLPLPFRHSHHNRSTPTPSPESTAQVLVASKQPPINLVSLRSLDPVEILKVPQLRHDLLFDSLAFRPVTSGFSASYTDTGRNASSSLALDARTNSVVAEMYWESVEEEIRHGCRCTRWSVPRAEGRVDSRCLAGKVRVRECQCGGWRKDLTEDEWTKSQASAPWPARLPELIRTLREILVTLMGSTSPCASTLAHTHTHAHAPESCPVLTHALVPQLYEALDPEFLILQVRRRVLGHRIFEMLGEAMKVHCAPVRDAMVDDMVRIAKSGDVVAALRMTFECVEIMKLDIANHQVHAMRPYLWTGAAAHELSAFHASVASAGHTVQTSATRQWMRFASMRVLAAVSPTLRPSLISDAPNLIIRSMAEGFLDLVFSPAWHDETALWPPAIQRRAGIQLADAPIEAAARLPEALRMDARRLKNFNAEVLDMALTHSIATAVIELAGSHTKNTLQVARELRDDVGFALDTGGALLPHRLEGEVSDFGLQLAMRACAGSSGTPPIATTAAIAHGIDHFLACLGPNAVVILRTLQALRRVLTLVLTNTLLAYRHDPAHALFDTMLAHRSTATQVRQRHEARLAAYRAEEDELIVRLRLSPMVDEMRELVGRMERIAGFNLGCFFEVYSNGMVVGGKAAQPV